MMRLEYGRMLQEGLDGVHGLTRDQLADLGRRFPGIQAEVRARRAAGEYGFHDLAEQGSAIRSITPVRQWSGPGIRSCPGAGHRRVGAGCPGVAVRASRTGVERAGRRGARFLSPADDPRQRGPGERARRTPPHRSATCARQRGQQVGIDCRDDGAVPRRPGLARGSARTRRHSPPRLHDRPGAGCPAGHCPARGDRSGRRATRRRWPLQRPVAGRAPAGGARRHRHRGAPGRRGARAA